MAEEGELEEILKRVRRIEMRTSGLVRESLGGEYHSSFKGEGIDFEDFREYQHGDDVRAIDWRVTARMDTPHIRQFVEERELSVLLAVDISRSGEYGSTLISRREFAAEIAALLAFSAQQNGDKIGLLLFSDQTELFLPPKKGYSHCLRCVREVLLTRAKGQRTDLTPPLESLSRSLRRHSLVFLLSDFQAPDFSKALKPLARQHDVVALRLEDEAETALPKVGTVLFEDAETGEQVRVRTSDPAVRQAYLQERRRWEALVASVFQGSGVDHLVLRAPLDQNERQQGLHYLGPLHQFFRTRRRRHD
ncbi:MAG: DUF58 domain-containing protein [Verrucomicrobiota bacterium]